MNKSLLILSILFSLMMIITSAVGQVLSYSYDESGNRILREPTAARIVAAKSMIVSSDSIAGDAEDLNMPKDSLKLEEPFRALVYPNPTTDLFTLELPDIKTGEGGTILIYDSMRQFKLKWPTVQQMQLLNIGNFNLGVYILYVTIGDKTVVRKIIKTLP